MSDFEDYLERSTKRRRARRLKERVEDMDPEARCPDCDSLLSPTKGGGWECKDCHLTFEMTRVEDR